MNAGAKLQRAEDLKSQGNAVFKAGLGHLAKPKWQKALKLLNHLFDIQSDEQVGYSPLHFTGILSVMVLYKLVLLYRVRSDPHKGMCMSWSSAQAYTQLPIAFMCWRLWIGTCLALSSPLGSQDYGGLISIRSRNKAMAIPAFLLLAFTCYLWLHLCRPLLRNP